MLGHETELNLGACTHAYLAQEGKEKLEDVAVAWREGFDELARLDNPSGIVLGGCSQYTLAGHGCDSAQRGLTRHSQDGMIKS